MKRYIAYFAILAALFSCTEKNEYEQIVPPTVDVTVGADIAFKAVGGTGYIEIAPVEGQLQATTDQADWCHLSVSGDRIDVKVDPYDGLESRYAVVSMTAGKATGKTIVHQFGVIVKDYSWKDITVKNEAQTVEFPYDANGTVVKAESDQNWVTFEATADKFTIHVAQNPTTDYREALVHWAIGEVTGEITVGQFDLEAAGLLGTWTWHGKQQPNNRDFPMDATLTETGDGVYAIALTYSTTTIDIDLKVDGVTLEANKLMLPLGNLVGTYTMKRTGVVYDAYPIVAAGTNRLAYADAVTTGAVPFVLGKDDAGVWQAVSDMTAWPDMFFRFEMWTQPEDDLDEPHDGISSSGLILADTYMVKE